MIVHSCYNIIMIRGLFAVSLSVNPFVWLVHDGLLIL
jgi:hypothetical protein